MYFEAASLYGIYQVRRTSVRGVSFLEQLFFEVNLIESPDVMTSDISTVCEDRKERLKWLIKSACSVYAFMNSSNKQL